MHVLISLVTDQVHTVHATAPASPWPTYPRNSLETEWKGWNKIGKNYNENRYKNRSGKEDKRKTTERDDGRAETFMGKIKTKVDVYKKAHYCKNFRMPLQCFYTCNPLSQKVVELSLSVSKTLWRYHGTTMDGAKRVMNELKCFRAGTDYNGNVSRAKINTTEMLLK